MSSISSIISNSSYSSLYSTQRSNASQMAADLFSQLDTSGKGYIDESQLESALSSLGNSSSTNASSSSSASQLFSQLDSDGDGKVTESEMTSGFTKLAEALDSQYNQSRMQGGAMPPPPPPSNDTGFTQDELTQQLSEIGNSDSQRSSMISNIVNNFSAADTNSDGKVTFQEAMAYEKSTNATASTGSTSSSTSSNSGTSSSSSDTSTTQTTDAQMFRQLMELMRAYGAHSDGSSNNLLSTLISTSA